MEQLNLFDFEEIINEEKMDYEETVILHEEVKEPVVEHKVDETVAFNTSLLKAERDESFQLNQKTTQLQVMHKVKIVLISEEVDSETHNFRKYYEPHLIGKVGEITNVYISSKGKASYEVDVYGQKSIFEEAELLRIG